MSILGTLADVVRGQSVAGGVFGGATYLTVPHSLPPGTSPDVCIPVLLSVQGASAMPALGANRAGLSNLNSIGVFGPSAAAASFPTLAFDVYSWIFWSGAR